jgi:hypothetical protein
MFQQQQEEIHRLPRKGNSMPATSQLVGGYIDFDAAETVRQGAADHMTRMAYLAPGSLSINFPSMNIRVSFNTRSMAVSAAIRHTATRRLLGQIENPYRLEQKTVWNKKRRLIMQLNDSPNEQKIHFRTGPRLLRRVAPVAIAAGLLAVGLSRPVTVAAADDDGVCTVATLKGRYLFADKGTLYPPAFGVTMPTPAANVGYETFNGDGTGTDVVTFRVGNAIVLQNFAAPTIYTVNADCTGTKTVIGGPKFGIFVSPDGSQVATISTDPGNYVASVDHRVSSR